MSNLLEQASLVMIPSGYKEDVVYSVIPTSGAGDLTFTRASTGTRIDSDGNVEVVPWNLLEQSETFGVLPWNSNAGGTVDNNATTAPNGTTTADRLNCTSSGASGLYQIFNTISGQSYTSSIYIKNDSNSTDILLGTDAFPSTANIRYNPSTNTIISVGSAITSSSVENVGNGWYRVVFSYVVTGSFNAFVIYSVSLTTNSLFVWGAQSNFGTTAKPYFPTTDRLNVPRLTYQNGGGGCPSLLLEKQSTNLALQSQSFASPWSITNYLGTNPVVTTNYGISPDGTQNATRIQLARTNTNDSYSQIFQYPISVTNGQQYTWSVWLKALSGTPTISIIGDFGRPSVTLTSEWVRYTGTATASSSQSQLEIAILGSNYASGNSLSADFLAWGYQFEQSSYPTSLIPTTSSSATRVADACYKNSISSLIGQSSGVVFADIVPFQFFDGSYIGISDNGLGNRQIFGFEAQSGNSGTLRFYGFYTGNYGTFYAGQRYKIAMAYANNDFVIYVNGTQVVNQTSGTVAGTLSHFGFDSYISSSQNFQGQVNEAILFPTRLTNAELASLTTL